MSSENDNSEVLTMVTAVLVWIGVVLAMGLLLTMALGPVIVQIDSKLYERKRQQLAEARTGR